MKKNEITSEINIEYNNSKEKIINYENTKKIILYTLYLNKDE